MFAPKATPKPILDELTNALDKALDYQNVRKRFFDLIFEIPDNAIGGPETEGFLARANPALVPASDSFYHAAPSG